MNIYHTLISLLYYRFGLFRKTSSVDAEEEEEKKWICENV